MPLNAKHITILTLSLLLLWCSGAMAQSSSPLPLKQPKKYPQEKVYVMTDRDLYLAGDTARMRAWVYDCLKHQPQSQSKYVYVELRDAADNLKLRVKLSDRNKGFRGYLAMPPTLSSGDYTLVAYTYYMLGTDERLLFKKLLHIMNPKDVQKGLLPRNINGNDTEHSSYDTLRYDTGLQPYDTQSKIATRTLNQREAYLSLPLGSNIAMSITADRLCRADSTSSIVWALNHVPEVFEPSSMPYEIGQTLSGTVYGNISTKKPQDGVKVSLVIPSKKITDMRLTDADGHFTFSGFDLPDSTMVLLSAKKGKRTQMENIHIDSDSLPEVITHLPAMRNYFNRTSEVSSDMKIVTNTIDIANTHLLDEIEVRGQKKTKVTETYQMLASRTMVGDELMDRGLYDLESAIMRFPGVQMVNGSLGYRGKPLRFFVDGLEEETDDDLAMGGASSMAALSYPMEVIERIDFVRPEDTAFLTGGAGKGGMAAICITLKSGADLRRASRSAALKIVFPLGYQKYKPFHAPDPDTAWPVIYWNSNITIKDSNEISRRVNSIIRNRRQAGDRGSYTVHIDGFTKEGKPIHFDLRFEI